MDPVRETLISLLKKLNIRSANDYKGVLFTANEFKNSRNPKEIRKDILNIFLWDSEAIAFIQHFTSVLSIDELAIARKERSDKDYFSNHEFMKIIKANQVSSELGKLYRENEKIVFGIRLRVEGNYYSFTTTGPENELEMDRELVILLGKK